VRPMSFLSSSRVVLALGWALGLLPFAACSGDEGRECRVGADCASGVCSPEGQCAVGAAPGGGTGIDPDASADSADRPDATAIDAALPGCVPNEDGTVLREEVPIQAGLHATFRVAKGETVSTAGVTADDGTRVWDFSQPLASDEGVLVETQSLAGKWYAPKFTSATYATRMNQLYDLVGVFEVSSAALTLNGVVSPQDGLTRTELIYDPPVPALKFPLKVGDAWTTKTNVSGVAQGIFSSYSEEYETSVDAEGTLETPLGKFHVLRVATRMTRTIGLYVTRVRTFAFVTECYGNVASVISKDNETDAEFTHAAEIRRIAP
jgi:hypothetical protein